MSAQVGFYVTVRREGAEKAKIGWLLGPYGSKEDAEAQVKPARDLAYEIDPRTHFDAFGVTRIERHSERPLPPGVLNGRLNAQA